MANKFRASNEMRDSYKKLCANWKWLDSNIVSIQGNYAGKWIAINGAEIVSVGSTSHDVKADCTEKYQQRETLILCVPGEEVTRTM